MSSISLLFLFLAPNHDGAAKLAVHDDGKVGFAADVEGMRHHHAVHLDALGRRLLGEDVVAKHLLRQAAVDSGVRGEREIKGKKNTSQSKG